MTAALWSRVAARLSVLVGLAHLVDEALIRPAAGSGRSEAPSSLLGISTVCVLACAWWPRLGLRTRALAAALLGTVFAALGGAHAVHVASAGPTGVDHSGVAAGVAGIVLLITAVAAACRWVRSPASDGTEPWVRGVATTVAAAILAVLVLLPVAAGVTTVHLPARPVAAAPAPGFSDTWLSTSDGLSLRAWYHPSANGAAVVLLNPSRGDHRSVGAHARLLAAHGYGVLAYDARGTGGSQGRPNGWGWTWGPDVAAAVDYVTSRDDVEDGRIGVLGLSTGADVAIEEAARDPRIKVVVADGATAHSFADRPASLLDAVSLWSTFAAGELVSGDDPAAPLLEAVRRVAPRPVLLIAGGSIPAEIPLNERYAEAGGPTMTLWSLPHVPHTAAIRAVPREYEQRVLALLDGVLLRSP